tara:strand:+ start:30 stop:650 length:621 start_codon:yes stop_codon:yes gene_type:complete
MKVYKHIRKDTNEVFYIGMGNDIRPYKQYGRNKHWQHIVNSVGYDIEIIAEDLTKQEAIDLEIELILKYGRRDLGTGSLVNLTPGGEYYSHWLGKHFPTDVKKQMSDSRKKYINEFGATVMTDTIKEKIRNSIKGKTMSLDSSILKSINGIGKGTKQIEQYNMDNELLNIWDSATQASIQLNISRTAITNSIKRNGSSNGFIWKRI